MTANLTWLLVVLSGLITILLGFVLAKVSSVRREDTGGVIRNEFRQARKEAADSARNLREEVSKNQISANDTVIKTIGEMNKYQRESLDAVQETIKQLSDTLDKNMKYLQQNNEKKLDEMRKTVDEKLQSTLEKRLGESFKIVSERLEAVQRGLGEMQNLATGVGDLKRVLTNVKARGTWGEVQLGAILEHILVPEQYERNFRMPSSNKVVEFAIRLPGQGSDTDANVWLPIDSKFPQEDYDRLVAASESADADATKKAQNALLRSIQGSAKDISERYISPPTTTDFAILFLPTEGLYAEVLRLPGLVEKLQYDYRVVIAGPTTLAAILNSLRMGFRTLAIERRSTEVWKVLAAVKTEFGKFSGILEKVKRQLQTASNTIDATGVRSRAMERRLRDVEALPKEESREFLELPEDGQEKS